MADPAESSLASSFRLVVYMEELKSDDIQVRLAAMHRLKDIAQLIGPDRTRSELLSFLTDTLYDEDEILVALAEQLGEFVHCIGGLHYAHCLLPPLENLATIEETAVRSKATDSILNIVKSFSPKSILDHLIPMVLRLSDGEWFTSRSSACNLFVSSYSCEDEAQQLVLRGCFIKLCKDETPMVRRAAASKIGDFCKVIDKRTVKEEMTPILIEMLYDPVDSVRLLALESCVTLLLHFTKEEVLTPAMLDTLRNAYDDRSWRVRYVVSTKITDLQLALGPELTLSELVPTFSKLLGDVEAEVRAAAASKIKDFCESLPSENRMEVLTQQIYPKISVLIDDPNAHVKSAVAAVIMPLSEIVGKDDFVQSLIPFLNRILEDENSDVRLNALSNLSCIHAVIGVHCLSESLLPAIVNLSSDSKWRVRLAVIEFMPLIASQLGVDFFNQQLSSLCFKWLDDNVFAVREAAVSNISALAKEFGEGWAEANIMPKLEQLISDKNYLRRLTMISLLEKLIASCLRDDLRRVVISLMLSLAEDAVANVRFNVAKAFKKLSAEADSDIIRDKVKPCLQALLIDKDEDVKYFANDALAALGTVAAS